MGESVASRSSALTGRSHSSTGSSSRVNGSRTKTGKGPNGSSAKGKTKAKEPRPTSMHRTQSNARILRLQSGPGGLSGTIQRSKLGGRTSAASIHPSTLVPSQFAKQFMRATANGEVSLQPPHPAPVTKLVRAETSSGNSSSNSRPESAARRASSRRSSKSSGSTKGAKINGQGLSSASVKRRLELADDSDYSSDTEWDTEDASEEAEGTKGENEQAVTDRKLAEAAVEAQRQRDLFAKVDRRSYSDPARVRTQPGLLSAIFHPDPALFPPDHPYRHSRSTQDILAHVTRPVYQAAPLQPTSSTIAAPVAAAVTAQGVGSPNLSNARQRSPLRLKGRPQDVEESESGEDDETNKVHVSESVAEKRLAMLYRQSRKGGRPQESSRPSQQGQQTNMSLSGGQAPECFYGAAAGPSLVRVATEPISLGYPYNLPPPMPPSTPRTIRRNMLTHELSESLRRNLLWERQVSKQRPMGLGRRAVTNSAVPVANISRLGPNTTSVPSGQSNGNIIRQKDQASQGLEEERKLREKTLRERRNRSWADDYHVTGW
ncbi:hypothetical protein ACEPAI_7309 [Sanghuangporus weigelae]